MNDGSNSMDSDSTKASESAVPAIHSVPFYGDQIVTIENGPYHYVAMRHIVENMGLSWPRQRDKLTEQQAKFTCTHMATRDSAGRVQQMLCMPVEKLQLWLASLNPNKIPDLSIRAKVERYQAESAIALHDYWTRGHASRDGYDGKITDLDPKVRQIIGGIIKSIIRSELADTISSVVSVILPSMLQATLASQTLMVRRGRTAGQIYRDAGFPPVKGIAGWFGNRLVALGCSIENEGRGELGLSVARVFDPDKARLWLDNGGRLVVEQSSPSVAAKAFSLSNRALLERQASVTRAPFLIHTRTLIMDLNLARQAVQVLVGLGWTVPHACGAVGNLQVESGLNPRAVGDRGKAVGLCQWHSDRVAKIHQGCGINVRSAGFADQLRALDWELRHSETQAMNAVARSSNAFQAGYEFCREYERPADVRHQADMRGRVADQIYRALGH